MECVTSDIEFTAAMGGTAAGRSLRGREGIEALFADIRDTWEEHRMVIEEIRDLGERGGAPRRIGVSRGRSTARAGGFQKMGGRDRDGLGQLRWSDRAPHAVPEHRSGPCCR
jgi:hypothetical protein